MTIPQALIDNQYKPGQHGGGLGKPSGKHISTRLLRKLEQHAKDKKGGYIMNDDNQFVSYADLLVERMVQSVVDEDKVLDPRLVTIIMNHVDGVPSQPIDVTTNGESVNQSQAELMAIAKEISAKLKEKKTS